MSDEEPEVSASKAKPIKMNYPPNSKKSHQEAVPEKKVVPKIITGTVVQRKKPLGRKIAETFGGDSASDVGMYVLFEVIIPAIKDMIVNSGKEALDRAFYGGSRPRLGQGRPQRGVHTSYQAYYPRNPPTFEERGYPPQRTLSQKARATHDFDEVVLESRGEAEAVLDGMGMLLDQYDVVTVSDLYDLLGSGATGSYVDDKWGWYDLRGASVTRVREGYLLNLPRTTVIE